MYVCVCERDPCFTNLLSCFQSDDDEDGSSVHAPHAAAVAHEVVQDGGKLGAHLQHKKISLKHFMYENDLTKCNLPVEFSGVHNRLALFYFKELCISVGVTN